MLKRLLAAAAMAAGLWSATASATLDIVITEGLAGARPVAIAPFKNRGPYKPPFPVEQVVADDLRRSGKFRPLDLAEMPQQPYLPEQVNYSLWAAKGVEAVVIGTVQSSDGTNFTVTWTLLDILSAETALINGRSDALEAHVDKIIAAFRVLRASGRLEPGLFSEAGVIVDATVWGAAPAVSQASSTPQTEPLAANVTTRLTAPDTARINAFIDQWRTDWASANIDAYLARYADNFQPSNGLSREQWLVQRRQRISKAGKIHVEIEGARSTQENGEITVEFLQRYRAANFADQVNKRLILREDGGRLMIVQEIHLPPPATSR